MQLSKEMHVLSGVLGGATPVLAGAPGAAAAAGAASRRRRLPGAGVPPLPSAPASAAAPARARAAGRGAGGGRSSSADPALAALGILRAAARVPSDGRAREAWSSFCLSWARYLRLLALI